MRVGIVILIIVCLFGVGWFTSKEKLSGEGRVALSPTHGDWKVECPAEGIEGPCHMSQRVIDGNRQLQLARFELEPISAESAKVLIIVPLGAWLEPGVAIRLGAESEPVIFSYAKCMPDGCIADGVLGGASLEKLRHGEQSFLLVADKAKKTIGVPFSTKGFGDAYSAVSERNAEAENPGFVSGVIQQVRNFIDGEV